MIDLDDEDEFGETSWGDADLAGIEAAAVARPAQPAPALSKQPTYTQHTLFGKPLQQSAKAGPSRTSATASKATEPKQPDYVINKRWDRGAFKRIGWGTSEGKSKKARGKQYALEPEDEFYDSYALEEEEVDYSKLYDDPDLDPTSQAPEMKLVYDEDAARTFVYPLNKPKRDYQYNIVRRALFTNVLCALPTGLGKTFIAAVVMLNFYRWYPKGKILFMAPTRPLVNQQIEACHAIAGIPASDAALITGADSPSNRKLAWQQRRVFYATPQTVANDLRSGKMDPSEVICVVVDEAHKASGEYAYCGVIRYLMTKNPHFRILALTATPGSKSEAVQNVVDNLHIGHIEIRCEESLDLRQYIHKKDVVEQIVPITGDVASLRDGLIELMKPLAKKCYDGGLIRMFDPIRLKPYAIQVAMKECKSVKWAYPTLEKLRKMAVALGYLLEHSMTSGVEELTKCMSQKNTSDDQNLQQLIAQGKVCRMVTDYVPHPKMDALRSLLLDHFSDEDAKDTRIMVFCHYRGVVEEIVEFLNRQKPLIRASRFVGQGTDKAGGKGSGQKQQQETIRRFREGEFNVLVATSIGEEGLDIGEVDLIVCYDSNKSPIRMLQRIGRTGRARQGKIVVLLTEGRDEQNWRSAQDNYAVVQHAILSGKALELYADCERLLPKQVQPHADLRPVDVEPFNADALSISGATTRAKADSGVKGTKRKRDYMPEGANIGFASASVLLPASKGAVDEPAESYEERENAACLSTEEERQLNRQWRRSEQVFAEPDAVIGPLLRVYAGMSSSHCRLRKALEIGDDLAASEGALMAWKTPAYDSFDENLVAWWDNVDGKGTGIRPYVSCRATKRPRLRYSAVVDDIKVTAHPEESHSTRATLDSPPTAGAPLLFAVPDGADSEDELPDVSTMITADPIGSPDRARSTKKSSAPVIDIDSDEDCQMSDIHAQASLGSDPDLKGQTDQPLLFAVGGLDSSSPTAEPSSMEAKSVPDALRLPLEGAVVPSSQPEEHEENALTSPLQSRQSASPAPPLRECRQSSAAEPASFASQQLDRQESHDSFEYLDDHFDDAMLRALDRVEATYRSDPMEMPPPPVPHSTVHRSGKGATPRESPALRRLTAELDSSSSPAVVRPGRRPGQAPIIQASDSSGRIATAPLHTINGPRLVRGDGKRRLGTNAEAADISPGHEARDKASKRRQKGTMHRNTLFDVEAINDDDSDEASSEAYASENESDRAFVDETFTSDGGTDMRIYRDSLGTQAPDFGFDPVVKPGAFRLKYMGDFDPNKVDPDDTYERDSFCASDAEDLVFTDSSQAHL